MMRVKPLTRVPSPDGNHDAILFALAGRTCGIAVVGRGARLNHTWSLAQFIHCEDVEELRVSWVSERRVEVFGKWEEVVVGDRQGKLISREDGRVVLEVFGGRQRFLVWLFRNARKN